MAVHMEQGDAEGKQAEGNAGMVKRNVKENSVNVGDKNETIE